jgi:methylated-DNA-[protein]-cysteine S-methyltransferase
MSGAPNFATFETALGFVAIAWAGRAVIGLRLPMREDTAARQAMQRRFPDAERASPSPEIARVIEAIKRYFAGAEIDFSDVEIDLGAQEPFFGRVYDRVRKLRWGETATYGAIARELSADPRAARDVGQAMSANPIPLIVPCHRVLAAGNRIGGFSAPGGSHAKAKMLEIEGVRLHAQEKPAAKQASFDF